MCPGNPGKTKTQALYYVQPVTHLLFKVILIAATSQKGGLY